MREHASTKHRILSVMSAAHFVNSIIKSANPTNPRVRNAVLRLKQHRLANVLNSQQIADSATRE
jgi:hypothetical protein